jgi:ABC-type glutathione transport system ATPase component
MNLIPGHEPGHEPELSARRGTGHRPQAQPDDGAALAAQVRGLVKAYGALTAVAGIDLEIRRGEIFALLGPNGAGKPVTELWLSSREVRLRDAGGQG